jgi:hypothetical protein
MTARPNGILAPIAILIAGVALGVAADRWLATSPRPSEAAAAHDDSGRDVAAALTDLRRAIDSLPASVREQVRDELSSATKREPVDTSESDVTRLTRAVEQLNEVLGKTGGGVGANQLRAKGALESWQGPGYASLEAMQRKLEGLCRDKGDDWADFVDSFESELTKAHLLWTREDVVDRYGAPDSIDTASGLGLAYNQHSFKIPRRNCWFEFRTQDGLITKVCFVSENDY